MTGSEDASAPRGSAAPPDAVGPLPPAVDHASLRFARLSAFLVDGGLSVIPLVATWLLARQAQRSFAELEAARDSVTTWMLRDLALAGFLALTCTVLAIEAMQWLRGRDVASLGTGAAGLRVESIAGASRAPRLGRGRLLRWLPVAWWCTDAAFTIAFGSSSWRPLSADTAALVDRLQVGLLVVGGLGLFDALLVCVRPSGRTLANLVSSSRVSLQPLDQDDRLVGVRRAALPVVLAAALFECLSWCVARWPIERTFDTPVRTMVAQHFVAYVSTVSSAMALAAFAGGFATALRAGVFGPARTPVRSALATLVPVLGVVELRTHGRAFARLAGLPAHEAQRTIVAFDLLGVAITIGVWTPPVMITMLLTGLIDARSPVMAELPMPAVRLARVGAFVLMAHVIARLPGMDAASRRAV